MTMADPANGPAFEDLTARARIREAAAAQFAEHGFEKSTIRGIATAAGVSPGLVRHHFGSKQALRETVDAHVLREIHRINDEVLENSEHGSLAPSTLSRQAIRPFQRYLVRALIDGSPLIATLFDQMVGLSEEWIVRADKARSDPPQVDSRTRAAVLNAMAVGVQLMHEHLSRVLGVDTLSPEGDRQVSLALLDIYSHTLISPELAETARAALDDPADQPAPAAGTGGDVRPTGT